MDASRLPRRAPSRALVLGASVALGLAFSVAVLGERGVFSPIAAARVIPTIPGLTVADDVDEANMPVVTSLRSDGEAERLGVRVGDRIAAIDGQPVRTVAGMDRAIRSRATGPVSLHILRGHAVWTVAIDRAAADLRDMEPHDAQDPSG